MLVVKPDKQGIKKAVKVLKSGGVIVYPTDTAYALGGSYDSSKVIKKILKIKNRKDEKFTIIASSINQVEKFFKFNKYQKKLGKKYWPGPFSIVVSKKFAVRVPKNEVSRKLARLIGLPLIATSANLAGKETLYESKAIIKEFKNKKHQPDLIVDAGELKKIKTSTVVKVFKDSLEVLRSGSVKI